MSITLDIINEKQISADVSGDEIIINVLKYEVGNGDTFISLTDTPSSYTGQARKLPRVNAAGDALEFTDDIYQIGELTESADIAINCLSRDQSDAYIVDMARTATTLTLSNLGRVFDLSMTKYNTNQDLVFTLAGAGLVFDVFDSTNNVFTRATTVTLSGTDSNNSWALSFKRTGITGSIIQVVGTIDSFA